MIARYVERYFGKPVEGAAAGEHTMYVRRAIKQVQAKQKSDTCKSSRFSPCLLRQPGPSMAEYRQLQSQKASAENLFYAMKSLDVDIANLREAGGGFNNQQGIGRDPADTAAQRREMEKSYDQFLANLHVYDPKMTEQERLVCGWRASSANANWTCRRISPPK